MPSVARCLYSIAFPVSLSLQLVSVAGPGSMAGERRNPRRQCLFEAHIAML